jgi:mRNA interferase MazF
MADLGAVRGTEQAGTRPVVVVQSDSVTSLLSTVQVVPCTTNLRWSAFPFCVQVARLEGGLTDDSVALCHQMRALDATRLIRKMGELGDDRMEEIESAIRVTLDI